MKTGDLLDVISANVTYTYYANGFPPTASDDCAVVRVNGGGSPTVHIGRPTAQVLVRAKSPQTADTKAWAVYDYLNQRTAFTVGTAQVVYCTAQQSSPLFIGYDESGRTVYSINFEFIIDL